MGRTVGMMLRTSMIAGALASATAFAPVGTMPSGVLRRRAGSSLSMQVSTPVTPIDIFKGMDGEGQDVRSSAFLIESEIKHGRLAMLAAVGYPVAELLHPYLSDTLNLPSLLTEAGEAPNVLNGGLEALFSKFSLTLVFVVFAMLGRVYDIEMGALRPRSNFVSSDPKQHFRTTLGSTRLGFMLKARLRSAKPWRRRNSITVAWQ